MARGFFVHTAWIVGSVLARRTDLWGAVSWPCGEYGTAGRWAISQALRVAHDLDSCSLRRRARVPASRIERGLFDKQAARICSELVEAGAPDGMAVWVTRAARSRYGRMLCAHLRRDTGDPSGQCERAERNLRRWELRVEKWSSHTSTPCPRVHRVPSRIRRARSRSRASRARSPGRQARPSSDGGEPPLVDGSRSARCTLIEGTRGRDGLPSESEESFDASFLAADTPARARRPHDCPPLRTA